MKKFVRQNTVMKPFWDLPQCDEMVEVTTVNEDNYHDQISSNLSVSKPFTDVYALESSTEMSQYTVNDDVCPKHFSSFRNKWRFLN